MTHNEKAIVAKEIFDYLELNPVFAAELHRPKKFNRFTATASMTQSPTQITFSELVALSDFELEELQKKINQAKAAKGVQKRQKGYLYYPRRSRF